MSASVKEIIKKIEKIETPAILRELDLYLSELLENDHPVDDILLEQSINQAITESEAGLGIKHEQIWEQLKLA